MKSVYRSNGLKYLKSSAQDGYAQIETSVASPRKAMRKDRHVSRLQAQGVIYLKCMYLEYRFAALSRGMQHKSF